MCLLTASLGDYIFGFNLHTNFVTLLILILGLLQIPFLEFKIPKFILFLFFFIFLQTFLLNFKYINFKSSISHFTGFFIFIFIIYSFVINNRSKIAGILKIYNFVVLITIIIALLQIIVFVTTGASFLPQDIISGTANYRFEPEIFNVIPRAPSLFSEPAHYATFLLPSVYISILHLTKISRQKNNSNFQSLFTIFGMIITFSIVGYFYMIICLTNIYFTRMKINRLNFKQTIISILTISILGLLILVSPLSNKVKSLFNQTQNQSDYNYTSSDLTGFALVSNTLVTYKSLVSTFFLGSGFNTHSINYKSFIGDSFSDKQILIELNKDDAGTLYLRILSELGLPGIFIFCLFLRKYKIKKRFICKDNFLYNINSLSLIMILCYSFREGSYLSVFFLFFLVLYYVTYIQFLNSERSIIGERI